MAKSLITNDICALYVRISREESGEHRESIKTQKKILDQYCSDNNYKIYDYYIDEGISGTTLTRTNFQRMLDDIKYNRVNTVIVKDLSRLGRNHLAIGNLLEKEFVGKVRFISVSENIDTAYGYDETIPLRNFVNEYYSKDLSKKVKSSLKNKASKTRISSMEGGFYGYKYKERTHDLIVDEDVKPIIELIFKEFIKGKNTGEIVKQINELNVPTPGYLRYLYYGQKNGYSENKGYKYKWETYMIRNILNKYEYTGNTIQYKTTIINKKVVRLPEELHYHLKNTHPSIISEKMYNDAQSKMKHIKYGKIDSKLIEENFVGLVYNDTGNKMTLIQRNGKCEYRSRMGNRYGIKAEDLKEVVLEEFVSLSQTVLTNEEYAYEMLLKSRGLKENNTKLIVLKTIYNNLTNEGSNLFRLKLTKQITNEEYKDKMDKLSKEINNIEKELITLENNKIDLNNFKVSFNHFKELLVNSITDDIVGFAKEVIERITVYKLAKKEYKIEIKYKYLA